MKQVWSSRFISAIIQIETIILLKGKSAQQYCCAKSIRLKFLLNCLENLQNTKFFEESSFHNVLFQLK